MRIALDYDKTYTADPPFWDEFVRLALARRHNVSIVTMRRPDEQILDAPPIDIVYTSRRAKSSVYSTDVWVDDSPHWIYQDSA